MTAATARAPFLDFKSFSVEEVQEPPPVRSAAPSRSPLLSVYELAEGEEAYGDAVRGSTTS